MSRRMAKSLSALLFAAALAVTQIPVSDAEASGAASDFQMEGNKLLKYAGTAEVVSVPDDVKEIGEEAFAGNGYLVKVTIGGNVEKIDYRAFADCDNLRTVKVGDSVTEVDTGAFSNNKSLKNVSLGASLKKIGSGIFAGCTQLSSLSVSEDNPYLSYSDGILYDDEKKILYAMMPGYERTSLTLPDSVEEICAYAFWGNPYLEQISLDSSLNSVPAFAFSNCIDLKSVDIPLPVRSIEAKAFEDCVNLQRVFLPDSMNYIHDSAFDGCGNVKFEATAGTYGAEFAASYKNEDVDTIEYEDVRQSEVISTEEDEEEKETETPLPVSPITIGDGSSGKLLGETSIVAGRAVVFIDNGRASVASGNTMTIDLGSGTAKTAMSAADSESDNSVKISNILSDNAKKGKDFPKYTVAGNKIACQAYYQNDSLTTYEIDDAVTEIGEFAFARSGLKEIEIPESVEKIDYGAFYHCDSLTNVSVPSTVKEIDANAFAKTPWLTSLLNNGSSPFVIVGDGILIAYSGTDSVVNIPDSVKQIGAEVFKDHMGITAVNIPDSVTVIGEAAFCGCRNLKTVNGGSSLVRVGDRAFQDCPLSKIVIPASMQEIGLGAYDCPDGTDTVIFEGTQLPGLVMGESSGRLSNTEGRTYAFDQCRTAVVKNREQALEGTVLESGSFGFHGRVVDESGNLVADLSGGAVQVAEKGVLVKIESAFLSDGSENTMATMPGNDGNYVLEISDSGEASGRISAAYSELYGGRQPSNLMGFDISLYDSTGEIPITRLGKQYITIQIPKPQGISGDGLHLVTLDSDGQLEAVEYQIVNLEDGDYIQFRTKHFSPYGLYQYQGYGGQGVVKGGQAFISFSGNRDDTPDTGDPIHPKWILALGLLAVSVLLFFFRGKTQGTEKRE